MEQECASAIEPFYRKQTNVCRSSAADKHFFSTPENKRLDGHENLVEKFALQHEAIYRSATKYGNTFVPCKKFREIDTCRVHKSHCSSVRESFRATGKDESISFS